MNGLIERLTETNIQVDNMEYIGDSDRRTQAIINSKSDNTLRSYRSDWKHFTEWCKQHNCTPIPTTPEIVSDYILDMAEAGYKYATINRRIATISEAHQAANLHSPTLDYTVKGVLKHIRKTYGTKQDSKKAILMSDLKKIIDMIDTTKLIGLRDKAIILLAFASACRREEFASIKLEDLDITNKYLDIKLDSTITKTSKDMVKSIEEIGGTYCPVTALFNWLKAAGIKEGFIWQAMDRHGNLKGNAMKGEAITGVVKKYVKLVGLDPEQYAAHSLRSGFVTSAKMEGVEDIVVMNQTGHTTSVMLKRYAQDAMRYKNNASSILSRL